MPVAEVGTDGGGGAAHTLVQARRRIGSAQQCRQALEAVTAGRPCEPS